MLDLYLVVLVGCCRGELRWPRRLRAQDTRHTVTPSLERRPLASSRRRRLCLLAAHQSIVRAHPRRTVQHVDGARQLAVRPPRPWRCPSSEPQSSKLHVRSANLHAWVASLRRHGGAQAARSRRDDTRGTGKVRVHVHVHAHHVDVACVPQEPRETLSARECKEKGHSCHMF